MGSQVGSIRIAIEQHRATSPLCCAPNPHLIEISAPGGAIPPRDSAWAIGDMVDTAPIFLSASNTSTSSDVPKRLDPEGRAETGAGLPESTPSGITARIDLSRGLDWPIKDQGKRGTSVAFAVTACVEYLLARPGAPVQDLSEQFLYWTTKTNTKDSAIDVDATRLEFAAAALADEGICRESDWPYCPDFIANNVGQGDKVDPTNAALSEAQNRLLNAHSYVAAPDKGGAALALRALQEGRLVAVSLPMFGDDASSLNNWSTPIAQSYGRVLNPPPSAVVVGGHAVCIVGFTPDPDEPNGGYFVFRNSLGTQWAAGAPSAQYSHAPAPGYGDISASYIDRYLWEMLVL